MNLVHLRKKAKLTQEMLAKLMNVDRSSIAKWETGKALPTTDKVVILSKILNCTTDEILTR